MEHRKIVAKMLGVDEYSILHWEFIEYLDDTAKLANSMPDCRFASRQTIALAVVTWIKLNPDKSIYGKN